MFRVERTEKPEVDYKKNVQENTPDLQEGNWKQVWNVTDATAEEIEQRTEQQANDVRAERNQLLSDCDWTQLADSTADKEAWAIYRQALRDLPQQDGFPYTIEWPTKAE